MNIIIRRYEKKDICQMTKIWNEVVTDGAAFPQIELLEVETAANFFAEQSFCGVAEDSEKEEIVGLYILHPNNVGRCGHICNASYVVKSNIRGQHIGEKLVTDCLEKAKETGFRILQFNAVVRTNYGARHLYEKLGFIPLGEIPGGFLLQDGTYEAIVPYYHEL